jgi:hypothetical protein
MAVAYAYAESNGQTEKPFELTLLENIDRFGVMAIMARPVMYVGEVYRMRAAENTITFYRSMIRSNNWAEWTSNNPFWAKLFFELSENGRG